MIKRTPIQRKAGTLKKGGPIKRKAKTPEQKKEQDEQYKRDWEFYRKIWADTWCTNESPGGWWHVCESCKQQIWGELKSIYIEHILEKSVYPQFRYEPRNIAIICGECHTRKTAGFVNTVYKARIDKAKRELLE